MVSDIGIIPLSNRVIPLERLQRGVQRVSEGCLWSVDTELKPYSSLMSLCSDQAFATEELLEDVNSDLFDSMEFTDGNKC